ncbi:MAG TPA: amino acid adenylation domain-containing protein [Pyrinomonadaceae bacterium]|nr:amino acid adenylation domain-containing protein [Pyrinomonadaceae bacterium]
MSPHGLPASFAQERLWFLDQLESGTAAYNLVRAFRINGPLNVQAMSSAVAAVVQRHESLRTVFENVDGSARQVVLSDVNVDVPLVNLTDLPENERKPSALRIASDLGKKPFDLTHGPLFRTMLLQLDRDQYILVLSMHHIITDGWSISILFRELAHCYEAFTEKREPDLPELPVQYSEYAQWQREYLTGDVLSKQVKYWKEKLAGAPTILDLPTDHPRPKGHNWQGATEELVFDNQVLTALKEFAHTEGATLFMVSMAAFQALLWRYTGQSSILVGTPTAGRQQLEIENLVGFFVNTLVFRADFAPGLTFRDLVRQVRSFSLEAYAEQDVPFEKLVEELLPQRSLNTSPLFQVMFTFQNIPKQIFQISGLEMEELEFETGIAKFDFSIEAFEDHGFHCRFEYNTDLFERESILRQMTHFRNLVLSVLKNPDQLISRIPLLDSSEREMTVLQWNNTATDYPVARIHTAFEKQAARTPDSIALISHDKNVKYRQINEDANRLAHYLRKKGVGPGSLVGVSLDRSAELSVALLGVLKTGAAYVPLDQSYPIERLKSILDDTGAECVVSVSGLQDKLPTTVHNLILLDVETEVISKESALNPAVASEFSDRAYVLYTSGSSGRPKGVEGTHRGALNRMQWMWERYPFQHGEVCCQKTNLGFVDSVWEIFGPLLAGVPSVILPQEAVLDPDEMLRRLAENRITRIVLVPSLLRALLEHAPNLGERLPDLKLWSCSGEVLPWELAKKFRNAYPSATLLNIYGSSEVSADVTWHEVTAAEAESGDTEATTSVPIGRPISNNQVYVLDEHMNPVPVGVRGEIYVGGEGLALGYWRQSAMTAERFVENPIASERSRKLYRTGDLGRWRNTGEIEYLGRMDSEVKVRGMRIELGEIETVLSRHEWVEDAVVELSANGAEQRLIAYVVGKEGTAPSARELRRYVRTKLPEHMVPASFVQVEELPLLSSGKVNRRALASVAGVSLAEQGMVAPRTVVEQKLAAMWAEVLKVKEVGVDQNFFELGGHSLLVLQVMARIRREFDVELGVRTMFEEPTITGLAIEVEKARATGLKSRTPVLERRPRPATANVSREALLAQLDTLSSDDVQTLLKRVLDSKVSGATANIGIEPQLLPKFDPD